MKGKISVIHLGVADVDRSVIFYRDGLGFRVHGKDQPGDAHVMFELEGTWLGLYGRQPLAEDAGVSAEGGGFAGFTVAHNAPSKSDVDAVYALALSAGGTGVKTPAEVFWGGYSGYFADPDGFLWEVCFNPFTDLS